MEVAVRPRPDGPRAPSGLRRASLARHLAALAGLLLVLMVLLGPPGRFSVDEGAAIAQARILARTSGWSAEHPFPAADPDETAFPIEGSVRTEAGWAPLPKHPVYPWVLSIADRVAGVPAMVGLSLLGSVAAAGCAALVARRLGPGLDVPTLWLVGVGSPLLLDGFVVIAHTVGAALAAAATLAVVRWQEQGRHLDAVAAATAVAGLVLVRGEGALYGGALALAVILVGGHGRGLRLRMAALLLATTVVAYVVDGRLSAAAIGAGGVEHFVVDDPAPGGFLAGRVEAFVTTWLRPSHGHLLADLLMAVATVAVVLGVMLAGRHQVRRGTLRLLCAAGAVAAGLRLLVAPRLLVPGLLLAFPVLVAGAVAIRGATWRRPPVAFLVATFGAFAAAVLATQYRAGGTWEWGGRYFAIGLPAVAPVAVAALGERLRAVDGHRRRSLLAGLAAVTLTLSASALLTLRSTHVAISDRLDRVEQAGRAGSAGDGGAPVVVSADRGLARFSGTVDDEQRWLVVVPSDLHAVGERLRGLGIQRFTLVAKDREPEVAALGRWYHPDPSAAPGGIVVPMERR